MTIIVRKSDGYVLNSDEFNGLDMTDQIDVLINNLDLNYYDVVDVEDPHDEAIKHLMKRYFYKNGELLCTYYITAELEEALKEAEEELASTDYIMTKAAEAMVLGQEPSSQYNYTEVAERRQVLRDLINDLRQKKEDYPFTSMYLTEPLIYKQYSNDKE